MGNSLKSKKRASDLAEKTPLDQYGKDLTAMACAGKLRLRKLHPLAGTDEEIRSCVNLSKYGKEYLEAIARIQKDEILSCMADLMKSRKRTPLLFGDDGVAVSEYLAKKIVERGMKIRLIALDIDALTDGVKFYDEFEDRVKSVLEEVIKSDGEIILFIDDMHVVLERAGTINRFLLMEPMRGRYFAATTLDAYNEYFHKDSVMESYYQRVGAKAMRLY